MRFNSLMEMRELMEKGELVRNEVIPVSKDELEWYKFTLSGLTKEERIKARIEKQSAIYQGFFLVI